MAMGFYLLNSLSSTAAFGGGVLSPPPPARRKGQKNTMVAQISLAAYVILTYILNYSAFYKIGPTFEIWPPGQ